MGVRLDADKAAESGAGAIVERVFVKKIAGGMRRDVILQRARIEFLSSARDGDCEEIAASAFADETAETFEARISSAKVQIEAHGRRVVIYDCRVHLQRDDVASPILRAHISHFRARAGDQVVHTAGESEACRSNGAKRLDHRDFGELVGDQKQMRKDGCVFAVQPMENLDRQFDFDTARHVKKCAGRNQSPDASAANLAEPRIAGCDMKYFRNNSAVLDHGALKRLKDDAALSQLIGNDIALDELIASEDQSRRDFVESARLLENRGAFFIAKCGRRT